MEPAENTPPNGRKEKHQPPNYSFLRFHLNFWVSDRRNPIDEVYLDSRNLTLEIRGGRSGTSGGGWTRLGSGLGGFLWWEMGSSF